MAQEIKQEKTKKRKNNKNLQCMAQQATRPRNETLWSVFKVNQTMRRSYRRKTILASSFP